LKLDFVRAASIPLNIGMSNASFSFKEMSTAVVGLRWATDKGPITGYAFNSTGRYSCASAINERFAQRLLNARESDLLDQTGLIDPAKILSRCLAGEKPGGDLERSMAIGTLEIAAWDALAKYLDRPLYQVLADRFGDGHALTQVPCYVGGGWYKEGEKDGDLEREIDYYLDLGYQVVKVKVGRDLDEDLSRITRVLQVLPEPGNLAVDANCRLNVTPLGYATAFSNLGLKWFEEPTHPMSYRELKEFIQAYHGPVATGENCFSIEEIRNLVDYGSLRPNVDFLQIDVPQTYGITYYVNILRELTNRGWLRSSFIPHGGNLMTLAVVAGLRLGMCESYPEVFGAFSGFYDGYQIKQGNLQIQNIPGIGFESQGHLMDKFAGLQLSLS